jgi:hypothetical protein
LPITGATNFPTQDQAGLLIYLNSDNNTEGFYVFNGISYLKLNTDEKAVVKAVFDGSNYLSTSGNGNQPNQLLKLPFNQTPIIRSAAGATIFEVTGNNIGEFTAPVTGLYRINAQLLSEDYNESRLHILALVKSANDGSNSVTLAQNRGLHRGFVDNNLNTPGNQNDDGEPNEERIFRTINTIVSLTAGERLELRFNDNFATFAANPEFSWFIIEQI